jgi:hypothetical protein
MDIAIPRRSPNGESDLMTGKIVVITAAHLASGAPALHSFPHPPAATRRSSKPSFLFFLIEFFRFLGLLLY